MSGREDLERMAELLRPLCSAISVREDEGVPYSFAVDHPIMYSLEVRHRAPHFVVEYWRGPMNEDRFITEASYSSFEEALSGTEAWLRGVVT